MLEPRAPKSTLPVVDCSLTCAAAGVAASAMTTNAMAVRMMPPLPDEPLAAGMVRTMDCGVTRNARPPIDANTGRGAGADRGRVIDRARMPRSHVAPLTEDGRFGHEHALVRRTVRVVARHASVATGRVLPEERAAFVGMARRAELCD